MTSARKLLERKSCFVSSNLQKKNQQPLSWILLVHLQCFIYICMEFIVHLLKQIWDKSNVLSKLDDVILLTRGRFASNSLSFHVSKYLLLLIGRNEKTSNTCFACFCLSGWHRAGDRAGSQLSVACHQF